MFIKYTDLYEKLDMWIPELNFRETFERNVWKEVSTNVGERLLRNTFFISKEDIEKNKELFKNPRWNMAVKRFGALGDLIQLLPVVRYLKKLYGVKFTLVTQETYVWIFKRETDTFKNVVSASDFKKWEYDKVFYLDGVLERDHSLVNEERNVHRIKLYEEFFNIKIDKYDFSLKIDDCNDKVNKYVINK